MTTNDDTFFDIHMHAFNLSHPYFSAFIKRYNIVNLMIGAGIASLATKLPLIGPFIKKFVDSKLRTGRNLLAIFENDIGSFFLITEDCLREDENPLLKNNELTIGTRDSQRKYQKIVLTPLMMDFGYKGKKEGKKDDSDYHYNRPSEKPIVEQVTDVFNAIEKYKRSMATLADDDLCQKFPFLKPGTQRVFEIYPFLGINTQHYELPEIEKMLDKYFMKLDNRGKKYEGLREDLFENMGRFDGKIDNIPSNFFAGVKVYPPLGFDPWPADKGELKKVECLYAYCSEHKIPITSHGGGGGFIAVDDKNDLKDYTSMSRWKGILERYPSLKLNIAHFPAEFESHRVLAKPEYKQENQRLHSIIRLIIEKDNVYTDFSCRASSEKYYQCLRKILDGLTENDRVKLTSRILFGSDYAVSLGSVDSYNEYLGVFSRTGYLKPEEKHAFCCLNPQRFLFAASD